MMPGGLSLTEAGATYSKWVGLLYIFNLIVGTGILTLPAAFFKAGWILSIVIVIMLAFMSYLTMTFVVEVLASSNALLHWRRLNSSRSMHTTSRTSTAREEMVGNDEVPEHEPVETSEQAPLLDSSTCSSGNAFEKETVSLTDLYTINNRIEMSQMTALFFNKFEMKIFYACLCIYLYGDLAIYGAAVSKTVRDVFCTYTPANQSCNATIPESERCWQQYSVTRREMYSLWLAAFIVITGPFVCFDVQKTKILQMLTSSLRGIAFVVMITLALLHLANGKGEGHPPIAQISGIPALFGACVYSFMCHHSIPSLVTPISDKHSILRLFACDYVLILCFYILVALTGIFSFQHVEDLYTLNFYPGRCVDQDVATDLAFLQYFLVLFPVFTLSTNFPIIGITLRNNLKSVFLQEGVPYSFFVNRLLFPILVVIVPAVIGFITNDLQLLVGITGSYAGAGVQYIVPAMLVFRSRSRLSLEIGDGYRNQHASPFRHRYWIPFVFLWSGVCIIVITVNLIINWS